MNKYYFVVLACFCILASQCKKADTTPQSPTDIASASPYINATIDSGSISLAPVNQYQAVLNNQTLGALAPDSSTETYNYSISSLTSLNNYLVAIYVGDEEFAGTGKPADSAFYGYFTRGRKKFSFGILATNSYHIAFNWIDNSGNNWQSNPPAGTGSGNQSGSSFVVDTFIQTTQNGNTAIKMQAHFNCKIYYNGNSKNVTNGTFVVYFENK